MPNQNPNHFAYHMYAQLKNSNPFVYSTKQNPDLFAYSTIKLCHFNAFTHSCICIASNFLDANFVTSQVSPSELIWELCNYIHVPVPSARSSDEELRP